MSIAYQRIGMEGMAIDLAVNAGSHTTRLQWLAWDFAAIPESAARPRLVRAIEEAAIQKHGRSHRDRHAVSGRHAPQGRLRLATP